MVGALNVVKLFFSGLLLVELLASVPVFQRHRRLQPVMRVVDCPIVAGDGVHG
jgi:hypothetical protein